MAWVRQPVLPLLPASAIEIGPVAGLVEDADGAGEVYVNGLLTFAFTAADYVGRRLAAVTLLRTKVASAVAIAAGFSVSTATVFRWRAAYEADGVAGLFEDKAGPKSGPRKLTPELIERVGRRRDAGETLQAIAAATQVSTDTVRRALRARSGEGEPAPVPDAQQVSERAGDAERAHQPANPQATPMLPVLADPTPRTAERRAARSGQLEQATVRFTEGVRLPLAGLWLALATPPAAHLLDAFTATYARLRNGFYGLRAVVLTGLFLALVREPRAEGLTRLPPADLGRLLGLDRAPEVSTFRRKLVELERAGKAGELGAALARAHGAARPDVLGWLHVDGHTRAYTGRRKLPKTRIARLHVAGHASGETWIADAAADPLLVVPALPTASLAAELIGCLPDLRGIVGEGRRATVIFDRGGWSPTTFAALIDAGFDLLTYRKAPYPLLDADCFTDAVYADERGATHAYTVAETGEGFDVGAGRILWLRQIMRRTADGKQLAILTSAGAPAAECCYRLAGRWAQENYLKYGRAHFALDALDSYAALADDPARMVVNPEKTTAQKRVDAARADYHGGQAGLSEAIAAARRDAGRSGGRAQVDSAALTALADAQTALADAQAANAAIPTHLPLGQVRPDAQLLATERKLITHAIRIAAYNAETTLARLLTGHYARAEDEARALIREAFKLSGDIEVADDGLHVRLDPASAPRRSKAIAALCEQLTATESVYPGTELKIHYSVKPHPTVA